MAKLFNGDLIQAGTGISAFSSGGGNGVQGAVDFGSGESEARVTVPATWANSSSIIVCSPSGLATADHDPDDYALDGISAYATNIVDGVGFDIVAKVLETTFGLYIINAVGV